MNSWQDLIAMVLIAVAAVYVVWRLRQSARRRSAGCGGCADCASTPGQPPCTATFSGTQVRGPVDDVRQ
jgi:hypothetical protein